MLEQLQSIDTPEGQRLRSRAQAIAQADGTQGFNTDEYVELLHEFERYVRQTPTQVLDAPSARAPVRPGGIDAQRHLGSWLDRELGAGRGTPLGRLQEGLRARPELAQSATEEERRLIDDALWEGAISPDAGVQEEAAMAELQLAASTDSTEHESEVSDRALSVFFDQFRENGAVPNAARTVFAELDPDRLSDRLGAFSESLGIGNDAEWRQLVDFGATLQPFREGHEPVAALSASEPVPVATDGSDLLVFGLNGGIGLEVSALRRGAPELTVIDDSEAGDDVLQMEIKGVAHRFDLSLPDERDALVASSFFRTFFLALGSA
ncbi:MAG: hypothetical protein AAFQ82_00500, partial [Myxococcota bacterium]